MDEAVSSSSDSLTFVIDPIKLDEAMQGLIRALTNAMQMITTAFAGPAAAFEQFSKSQPPEFWEQLAKKDRARRRYLRRMARINGHDPYQFK